MHSTSERYRIILSRIAAVAILFFLFTTQSVWETRNEKVTFFLFLAGMILVGIASLGRMWCSLYIAGYKDDKLVTDGPYSLCRNPLYFFQHDRRARDWVRYGDIYFSDIVRPFIRTLLSIRYQKRGEKTRTTFRGGIRSVHEKNFRLFPKVLDFFRTGKLYGKTSCVSQPHI